MNETQRTKLCKSLSYVLRHRPDSIGLQLDESGWAEVAMLPSALEQDGRIVTRLAIALLWIDAELAIGTRDRGPDH